MSTGESFTVSASVRNQGDDNANSTTLRYYRSTDATISTSDTQIGTDGVSSLSAGSTSSESDSVTAPTTPGTYYTGACVDSVSGESDTGNNCSSGVQITVTATSTDDNYEENDTSNAAYDLSSDEGTWLRNIQGLGIQSDDDWYEIYVDAGYERVMVNLDFVHADGDIDLALYDSTGSELDFSAGISDEESIDYVVPVPGTYYLKVYYEDNGNTYDLWWDDVQPVDGNCVKDNVTGLIWEVKTDDGGLHDKDAEYTWYNSDSTTNGGDSGKEDGGYICYGYDPHDPSTFCNTQAYVARVNRAGLCGYSDWRLPTLEELRSLVDYSVPDPGPKLDTGFFPNALGSILWSSSPVANHSDAAWVLSFDYGIDERDPKGSTYHVRLVRGGQ